MKEDRISAFEVIQEQLNVLGDEFIEMQDQLRRFSKVEVNKERIQHIVNMGHLDTAKNPISATVQERLLIAQCISHSNPMDEYHVPPLDECCLSLSQASIAKFENYTTDSPGYQGTVFVVIWSGGPELVSIFCYDKEYKLYEATGELKYDFSEEVTCHRCNRQDPTCNLQNYALDQATFWKEALNRDPAAKAILAEQLDHLHLALNAKLSESKKKDEASS